MRSTGPSLPRVLLALALVVVLAAAPAAAASAQASWVAEWLREYSDPATRAAVIERLPTIVNLGRLQADLDALLEAWLKEGESEAAQRRVIAAFALEAAEARLGVGPAAAELTEWACRQVRRIREPGEFERRWHLAAFAVLAGAVDAEGLESHAGHMRLQFRDEPRVYYERAVAEELRAAPFFEGGRASPGDVERRYQEAAKRYREAAKHEAIRPEAHLRLGRVEVELGRPEEALTVLDGLAAQFDDDDLRYLAHLFRGRALEQLGRLDEARTEYGLALGVRPRAQSASMALAALLFRTGQRGVADQIVAELLGRAGQPRDPWWSYWPADYREIDRLLAEMREALV